jgi:hypothetical protein
MKSTTRYIMYVLILVLAVYLALLDTLAKPLFESQATEMYGAEVTVDSVKVSPFVGKITLYNVQVANRSDPMRNLIQAERAYLDIDMVKLANDVIELDEMELEGLVMFSRREQEAIILRPLVPKDSALARFGLPSFDLPDPDRLIERQREKLEVDLAEFRAAFIAMERKWQLNAASLPTEEKIAGYRARIEELRRADAPENKADVSLQALEVQADIRRDIDATVNLRQEFRGDVEAMRELVDLAGALPGKHAEQLIDSLGLSSAQTAQLGSRLLRGDVSGLLRQILAPLAYTEAGLINAENNAPIFIHKAMLSGPLLPSAAGLSVNGELRDFTWPLEIAESPASLVLTGNSLDGGSLKITASIDHRAVANDLATIEIENISLRDMYLSGSENMDIVLTQSRVSMAGEMRVNDTGLSGEISQQYSGAVFNIELAENAGSAARLVAAVLENNSRYQLSLGFGGTLSEPEMSYSADLDDRIQTTVRDAIAERLDSLIAELQNRISGEIGPQIATSRAQFEELSALEAELEKSLGNLNALSE